MRKSRWIAATGAFLFAVSLGATAPASAAPAPAPTAPGVGDYGHALVNGPAGTAPLGRINVQVNSNLAAQVVTPTLKPKALASAHPRPYGGEQADGALLNKPNFYERCTMAFGTQSSGGARYELTAGHCTRPVSGPPAGNETGDGPWYYPPSTHASKISTGPAQSQYDSTGDQAALKTIPTAWTPTRQVKTSATVYTLTAGGNPVLYENTCLPLGNTNHTICGFISDVDYTKQWAYDDGTVHGNMAIIQSSDVAGCPVPGASGSPALAGTEATGILSGAVTDGRLCWIWSSQLGHILGRYQLFLAPPN